MDLIISKLEAPLEFWEYFEKISKIPRCSGNEEKIRKYIVDVAKNFNFETKIDDAGNVLVNPSIDKRKKNVKKICLQSHMDMVCEKNETYNHDFLKDPLKLEKIMINNEIWLTAVGTTLGADNGVGIAYSLVLMKKIHDRKINVNKCNLSFLFTVDEESGLQGAFNIDPELLDCDYLLNLDSENDETITIGCAGGVNTSGTTEFQPEEVDKLVKEKLTYKLSISGLIGGHSGVDIHRGRVNALKLIGKVFRECNRSFIFLHSLHGGNRTNAIPREAHAIFSFDKKNKKEVVDQIEKTIIKFENDLKQNEPSLKIEFIELNNFSGNLIIPDVIKNKIINLICSIPNGPISFHPRFSDLVHTSSNLASIKIGENYIEIKTSQRSLDEYSKQVIRERIEEEFKSTGLNFQVRSEGDYPGWTPNFDSKLLLKSKQLYKKLFDKDVVIKVVHAGLECGILKQHFPGMEMISIGPTINGAHSPDERLKISSIKRIWDFLLSILAVI